MMMMMMMYELTLMWHEVESTPRTHNNKKQWSHVIVIAMSHC